MADDVPVNGGQQQSLYNRVDGALNRFFTPINGALERMMGPRPSWQQQIIQGLSLMRPGGVRMGAGMGAGMPRMPQMPNQPTAMPTSNELILRMLRERANPQGVLQQTRSDAALNSPFRAQTFSPTTETSPATRLSDVMHNRTVLTPANQTGQQSYNMSLINQLMRGK